MSAKIEHANGRAIESASSKVHGELTRLQVSSNLRHTYLVAASRKIERKNRTTNTLRGARERIIRFARVIVV